MTPLILSSDVLLTRALSWESVRLAPEQTLTSLSSFAASALSVSLILLFPCMSHYFVFIFTFTSLVLIHFQGVQL